MKKIMTIIAMGVLYMSVTSCSSVNEEAYLMEHNYKLCREKGWSDTLTYKLRFVELYQSMSYSEQQEYKAYRERMDTEARELRTIMEQTETEAIKMLSE